MKKILIALLTTAALSACTVTPEQKTNQQVEISSLQSHAFCKGDKLQSYIETSSYYQFTCSDGRYFMLPKEK